MLSASPLGPQYLVDPTLAPPEAGPANAILNTAGDFIVTWQSFEQDGSGFGVYAKLFNANGTAIDRNSNGLDDDTFLVNVTTTGDQFAPTVASDGQGNFVIAWQSHDGGSASYDVFMRQGTLADGLTGGEVQVNTLFTAGDQSAPSVAADSGGNFVIAWQSATGDVALGMDIYAKTGTFAGGLAAGDESLVSTTNAGDQLAPAVAMAPTATGDYLVAWQGPAPAASPGAAAEEETGVAIVARLFRPGAGDSGEFVVSPAGSHDAVAPAAAMNAAGDFVVAWQAEGQTGSGSDIFVRQFSYTFGTEFVITPEAVLPVNTTTQGPQRAPAVGMDTDGNFLVTWQSAHQDAASWAIIGRRFDVTGPGGGAFGDEVPINNLIEMGPQTLPTVSVGMGANGRTVVSWLGPNVPSTGGEEEEGGGEHAPAVHARIFTGAGATPITDELLVSNYAALESAPPRAATSASGRYVVVWEDWQGPGDGSGAGIYARILNNDGTPVGPAFLVNSATTGEQRLPAVAMNYAGDFVVVWQSALGDGSGYGIYARRFAADGAPAGPELLVNTTTGGNQTRPVVGMDVAGNFVVVWQSADADGQGVFAQLFDVAGNPVGGEIAVNSFTALDQVSPAVSMNAKGQFAVVWVSDHLAAVPGTTDTEKTLFARFFDVGAVPAGPEFQVNTYTKDAQEHPAIGLDNHGRFAIAWQSINQEMNEEGSGSSWGVYARQFWADGTSPQTAEVRINETVDGPQRFPAVGVDASGNFVVAWQSNKQDTSSWGVYSRQFGVNGLPEGGEVLVNNWTEGPQINPAIARQPTGDYAIFWSGSGTGHIDGVYGRSNDWVTTDPAGDYIRELYLDILGRDPDAGGYSHWLNQLNVYGREAVARGIWVSPEHRAIQVSAAYRDVLGREADQGGLAFYVSQMASGWSEEQVLVAFLSSPEYLAQFSDQAAYVGALYTQVLGRSGTPDEVASWVGLTLSPSQIALGFVNSPERHRGLIDDYYLDFLDRLTDPVGEQSWQDLMDNELWSDAQVAVAILGSVEHYLVS